VPSNLTSESPFKAVEGNRPYDITDLPIVNGPVVSFETVNETTRGPPRLRDAPGAGAYNIIIL
jgi:hypothetical protein